MPQSLRDRKLIRPGLVSTVAAACTALAVSACGSSATAVTGQSIEVPYTSQEAAIPIGTGVPTYVPSLGELYKGTEQAPPSSGPSAAKNKFVVYVTCGLISEGCTGPGVGAAEAAKVLGWRFAVTNANLDIAGGFSTAIRQAIAEKPNAIILYGFDCDLGQPAIAAARAAHIVVEGLLVRDCGTGKNALFSFEMKYNAGAPSTNAFWGQYGALQAAYAIDAANGRAKAILVHETDSYPAQVPGIVDMLRECSGCSVVDTIDVTGADYVPGSPMANAITVAMKQHPDANTILLNVDSALTNTGVAQALRADPAAKNMTIIAGGGTPAGFELMKEANSPYKAGIMWDMAWQGWAAMDALNRYFQGQPQVYEGVGFRLLTAGHITSASPDEYQSPIDFQAAYTKIWRG
jgi:ribose transport system substrate-binding protein